MNRDELAAQIEMHHASSFGWALSCCRWDRDEAEDALQASYLKVWEGRARFDGRSQFRTWLFGVIRRTAGEHRARRVLRFSRFLPWSAGHADSALAPDDPARSAAISEECRRVREALLGLAPRQREVLHLVFYLDMTIEEAARVIGLRTGTARTHYERGKKRLRALLAAED